ncbi:MAG: hypothetical protein BM555_05515 [Crocinitomix sp. MedPE-SWsnd]|nr:MAG: hypothetical protein BM555_05515 [Crocinitomix sp. MedPE-SWsnd]
MSEVYNLEPFEGIEIDGSYILLVHPQTIPHLIFIHHGKYFSLTHKEVEVNLDLKPLMKKLCRLKKRMIFLKLKKIELDPVTIFERYEKVDENLITCLFPIKELVLKDSEAEMIFQLIPELYDNQLIEKALQFNLTEYLDSNGSFTLNEYKKEAIFSYIQQLNKQDAGRE